jgi:1-phosphatidylinositol-4-phosphate 5-kinase
MVTSYKYLAQNRNSLLTRLFGLHSVRVQNTVTIYVVVMGNLFNTPNKIHECYDLKVDKNYLLYVKKVRDRG